MLTSFQKLCIRPDPGFAYDPGSMVKLTDGISFSEMLVKITSKCDTSLMLLSSHRGAIKNFAIKVVGLKSSRAPATSVTSAVFSGIKKSLSFFNGSTEEPTISNEDLVGEAWQDMESEGYHGMQVLALIDEETMPDNESRELYNLWQFVTITLQSINAYYMFQRPVKSFLYDSEYSFNDLMKAYPNADSFGFAVLWEFESDVKVGSMRATPIIRSSVFSDIGNTAVSSPIARSTKLTPRVRSSGVATTPASKRKASQSQLKEDSIFSDIRSSVTAPRLNRSVAVSMTVEEQEDSEDDQEEFEDADEAEPFPALRDASPEYEPNISKLRVQSPIAVTSSRKSAATPKRVVPPSPPKVATPSPPKPSTTRRIKSSLPPAAAAAATVPQISKRATRKQPVALPSEVLTESPAPRKVRGTPKKQAVVRPTARRGRKEPEPLDESVDDEVSIKPQPQEAEDEPMETNENEASNNKMMIDPSTIDLPFDDTPAPGPKPRGGRKSMVASARKSLANEWPKDDQDHMLHFFDNLNPKNSETSRIALTCKYALIQYDRDLSSKLLFQWVEAKGRSVQTEVTNFTLAEDDQKTTVLKLFQSLSDVQNEATRVSFVLKFIQTQYGVAITSKQLYAWLKEKAKKTKK